MRQILAVTSRGKVGTPLALARKVTEIVEEGKHCESSEPTMAELSTMDAHLGE